LSGVSPSSPLESPGRRARYSRSTLPRPLGIFCDAKHLPCTASPPSSSPSATCRDGPDVSHKVGQSSNLFFIPICVFPQVPYLRPFLRIKVNLRPAPRSSNPPPRPPPTTPKGPFPSSLHVFRMGMRTEMENQTDYLGELGRGGSFWSQGPPILL
jgi:hypothetical protein